MSILEVLDALQRRQGYRVHDGLNSAIRINRPLYITVWLIKFMSISFKIRSATFISEPCVFEDASQAHYWRKLRQMAYGCQSDYNRN